MNDSPLKLEEAQVTDLEAFVNPSDLRRDVHVFMDYARGHEIKRGHRDNRIPRAHQQHLAKLMSDPASAGELDAEGRSAWIEHVDGLCLALKLVKYDTEASMQAIRVRSLRTRTTTSKWTSQRTSDS